MKKNYEELLSVVFKILGLLFLVAILGGGFYFLGYLWTLLFGIN
jgi:hypothetical protein